MKFATYRGTNRRTLMGALACFVVAMLINMTSN